VARHAGLLVDAELNLVPAARNGLGIEVSKLPELVGTAPAAGQSASFKERWNTFNAPPGEPMKTERPDTDAELSTHEPLRIVFALFALLLGLVAAIH
jgi:hypothetical protein